MTRSELSSNILWQLTNLSVFAAESGNLLASNLESCSFFGTRCTLSSPSMLVMLYNGRKTGNLLCRSIGKRPRVRQEYICYAILRWWLCSANTKSLMAVPFSFGRILNKLLKPFIFLLNVNM